MGIAPGQGRHELSPEQCECLEVVRAQFSQENIMIGEAVIITKGNDDFNPHTMEVSREETWENVEVSPDINQGQKDQVKVMVLRGLLRQAWDR